MFKLVSKSIAGVIAIAVLWSRWRPATRSRSSR